MINIFLKRTMFLSLVGLAFVISAIVGCQKDGNGGGNPVITKVTYLDSAQHDSSLVAGVPGKYVTIWGSGFEGVQKVLFNGEETYLNTSLMTNNILVVRIPTDVPNEFTKPDASNTVDVITNHGTVSYNFRIAIPAPTISTIVSENVPTGGIMIIKGTNFYNIKKVIFPGNVSTTAFTVSDSSRVLTVIVPAVTTAGPLTLQGQFGSVTTTYPVQTAIAPTTGMLCDFTSGGQYNQYSWGASVTDTVSTFTGNIGKYADYAPAGAIGGGDNSWWGDNRAIVLNKTTWISPATMATDPVSNYALKFEVNTKYPWTTGFLTITTDPANFTQTARYAPYELTSGTFTTPNGWQTATIPLTAFAKGGNYNYASTGTPVASWSDIVDANGQAVLQMCLINDGSKISIPAGKFLVGIDNIRIVKVK